MDFRDWINAEPAPGAAAAALQRNEDQHFLSTVHEQLQRRVSLSCSLTGRRNPELRLRIQLQRSGEVSPLLAFAQLAQYAKRLEGNPTVKAAFYDLVRSILTDRPVTDPQEALTDNRMRSVPASNSSAVIRMKAQQGSPRFVVDIVERAWRQCARTHFPQSRRS